MEELTYWKFREELYKLVEGCVGNKKETAKRKASKFYNKYSSIIDTTGDWYKDRYKVLQIKYDCLKSGSISFDGGVLKLSEIESIKSKDKGFDTVLIEVSLKSGKIISFTEDFKWLIDILS